jgi:transcriptional regulator with XRE-family HTH domain
VSVRSPAHAALGQAIREARERSGLSQEGLGLEIGLDRTYVGGIERGERNPSYASLLALAAGLKLKASELVARAEQLKAGR